MEVRAARLGTVWGSRLLRETTTEYTVYCLLRVVQRLLLLRVAGKAVVTAAVVVGRSDKLIEPKLPDTKLVEARVLPGLGRRL